METRSNFGSQKFGTTKIRNDNQDFFASIRLPFTRVPVRADILEVSCDDPVRAPRSVRARAPALPVSRHLRAIARLSGYSLTTFAAAHIFSRTSLPNFQTACASNRHDPSKFGNDLIATKI